MFHSKDGWFFVRLAYGKVAIEKHVNPSERSAVEARIVLTPEDWASIVASVSSGGEINDRYQKALDFHNG